MSFNINDFYAEKEQAICNDIVKKWEELDDFLFQNKEQKYKVVNFKKRNIKTKFGLISFKRRIYKYYNIELKKWLYISLLDQELKIKKYKRFYHDVYHHIINFLGDGKRYRDIKDTIPKTNISLMTISRFFQNYHFKNEKIERIKVNDHETIYINLDDCFMNFNKLHKTTYKFRIVSFNTGINKQNKKKPFLINKRMAILINKTGLRDSEEKYVDFIWAKLKQFYQFENAKIVIGGDGARWIRNVSKWFGASYVLDRFHALKLLWSEYRPNNQERRLTLNPEKFNKYQIAKSHFANGEYQQLINFLKITNVSKAVISLFRSNKEGIISQNKSWNIGVSAESDVFHFVKSLKGNGSKMYSEKTYINMVNYRIAKFNQTYI